MNSKKGCGSSLSQLQCLLLSQDMGTHSQALTTVSCSLEESHNIKRNLRTDAFIQMFGRLM
jgi:hypothetical protein